MSEKLTAAVDLLNAEIAKHRHDLQRAEARPGAKPSELASLRHKIDCKLALIYTLTKQNDLLQEQENVMHHLAEIVRNRAGQFERARMNVLGGNHDSI